MPVSSAPGLVTPVIITTVTVSVTTIMVSIAIVIRIAVMVAVIASVIVVVTNAPVVVIPSKAPVTEVIKGRIPQRVTAGRIVTIGVRVIIAPEWVVSIRAITVVNSE